MDHHRNQGLAFLGRNKNILVVTGSRAEFGLMLPVIRAIEHDPELDLTLVVTGSHLDEVFGKTVSEIIGSGVTIDAEIEILVDGDTSSSISKAVGHGVINFTDYFSERAPDICLFMGDRYEMLAAGIAAFFCDVPIAHISGGELSLGSKDDQIRHLITKLSSLHFVSAVEHRKRVIQMGTDPKTVFNVGEPGLDTLLQDPIMSRQALQETLDFELREKLIVLTYHPATSLPNALVLSELQAILVSLNTLRDIQVVCTLPNNDQGWVGLRDMLETFRAKNSEWFHTMLSLGRQRYIAMVDQAELVIGNSSSGLVEVPMIGTPTVNVGMRQTGRLAGESVISVAADVQDITAAINLAMTPAFAKRAKIVGSPYGDGNASLRIVDLLKSIDVSDFVRPQFHDIDWKLSD